MAPGSLIPVEEYLSTCYRPDRDYVEGEVLERNLGEMSHGRLQCRIAAWMFAHERRWRIRAAVEVRLQINPRRFRIPDVMVLSVDSPYEEIVRTAPLICIEILSSCDTPKAMWSRAQDYFSIGVPVCWMIDPRERRAWVAIASTLEEVNDGILRASGIEMPLAEVFE